MTPTAPELTAEQYSKLEQICAAVAKGYMQRFSRHSLEMAELVQIAMVGPHSTLGGALKAHRLYDGRGAYTTWIGRAAHSALIDHMRQLQREHDRVEAYGRDVVFPTSQQTFADGGPNYDGIFEKIPAKLNRERGAALGANAYAAAMIYRERHGLSSRMLWLTLRTDAALCRMLGFPRCPARSSLLLGFKRLRGWVRDHAQ